MPYCIYLRKSRADAVAEAQGAGETLARHKRALLELAQGRGLVIERLYEEIVSGDTIASRPQMRRLLEDVSAGAWEGVLVMEIERLARGDTIDQGLVAQAFKYSDTRIITPNKIYDPRNEMDEEFFEFNLFMARREYKAITRRMQAGRVASVREGNYMGTRATFGYDRAKRAGGRGWTLVPNARADVVRQIFAWYTGAAGERLGTQAIALRLADMGVTGVMGATMTSGSVKKILRNAAYIGAVQWYQRKKAVAVRDGERIVTRPRSPEERIIVYGAHEPLIPRATFDAAQALLDSRANRPLNVKYGLANPLAGLIECGECGGMMRRKADSRAGRPPLLRCPAARCVNHATYLHTVEAALLDAIGDWTLEYPAHDAPLPGEGYVTGCAPLREYPAHDAPSPAATSPNISMRDRLQSQLRDIATRRARLYNLLEQGVYSAELFSARETALSANETAIQSLLRDCEPTHAASKPIISSLPRAPHLRSAYAMALSPADKNSLLRTVLKKAIYLKPRACARNENPAAILEMTVFLNCR